MRADLEHKEQVALFRWSKMSESKYPCLSLMHAIPNGASYGASAGKSPAARAKDQAARARLGAYMKAEGVKAGVLDVDLPVPSGEYIGLRIEMKAGKGTMSPKQKDWAAALESVGHKVVTCWNWAEAKDEILNYLANCKPEILAVRRVEK